VPPLWQEYVGKGWLGAKTARGFYDWGTAATRQRPVIPQVAGESFDPRRVLVVGINAAAELVALEAATVADLDKAVKLGLGFPKGMLEWADEIGLDVVVQLLAELQARYGDRYRPQPILTEYVQGGSLGRKAGRGFYTYAQHVTEYKTLLVRREPQERLAWLMLNRPQRLNTLTAELLDELATALDQLEQDAEVRAIILTGAGERAFSAGADVSAFQQLTPVTGAALLRKGQTVFRRLETLSKPVVAAIRGYALGGGSELAWACDFRLASQSAQFGQPEIALGLIPGWGGTQRLVRLVGLAKAKEIVLLGDRYSAEEAHRLGLVHRVVPEAELEGEARRLATRLAAAPPIAIRLAKACLDAASDSPLAAGLALETQSFLRLFGTEDLAEGLLAFLAKRKPDFKGK
jgi:enoyl-CoA hydratase/3-hydroxyacyl-CoA dehydrogenase